MPSSEIDEPAATATLAVLCKRPRVGVGKQRVAADIGAIAAAELAGHLLNCVMEDLRAWPGPCVISPASADDAGWAGGLVDGIDVVPQVAGNLGTRINALDATLRAAGHTRIIYLGSDAPLITSDYLAAAGSALGAADIVLGAAEDGGVILMGAAAPWPALTTLPWSTEALGRGLADVCSRSGLTTSWLSTGLDVDELSDFAPLSRGLAGDPRPARRALAAWLESIDTDSRTAARRLRGAAPTHHSHGNTQ